MFEAQKYDAFGIALVRTLAIMVAFSLVTDDIQGQTVTLWPKITFNCSAEGSADASYIWMEQVSCW